MPSTTELNRSSLQVYLADSCSLDTAMKSSQFILQMNEYIDSNPLLKDALQTHDLLTGLKTIKNAARYKGGLNTVIQNASKSSGLSILGIFIDRFGAMAKYQQIPLNE